MPIHVIGIMSELIESIWLASAIHGDAGKGKRGIGPKRKSCP
jgi:hypothetical protein